MKNSLLFKLMGAFLLVIAIGTLVIALLTSEATQKAFTLFTTRSGQIWAERLSPVLADYYVQSNGWQGVDLILQPDFSGQYAPSGSGNMMGQGRGNKNGQQTDNGMMNSTDQRLILADDRGIVVSDTANEWVGNQLSDIELQNGSPIKVNETLVGTLIITPSTLSQANSLTQDFFDSVNKAIVSSAIIAGIIALLLGTLLFVQITSPLRQLKKAALAITNGDLNQRVNIHSKDEFDELGVTFNRMAEQLSQAESQRQHLMADVAHELRTPLTAIQGTLEAMQDGVLPLNDEQISALYSETTILNRLVGDLKLLAAAEAGQLKLELQETDPGELIRQIVERIKPQANQKAIHLEAEIQADMPKFHLDPDRITQVVNNLIINSLRYTPQYGSILVQAAVRSDDNYLQIAVTDTGQGINPEDIPYIFDRFYRADKSRTRSSGGSGLGLAIVKQLVEAHGGKVHAESPAFMDADQNGYGTKIIFTLAR